MGIYYLDSSAVVKRYINETGSTWIRQLCEESIPETTEKLNLINIGEIAAVEVAAAFSVLARQNIITKRVAERAYQKFISEFEIEYELVHLTPNLLLRAADLTRRHPLKAYDAVQLALVLHTQTELEQNNLDLTFVTSDNTLLRAAENEGLAIDNPHDHAKLDNQVQSR